MQRTRAASHIAGLRVALTIAALSLVPGNARAQSTVPAPAQLEFRQLHPDARKLLVEEIRIQIQTEQTKQFDALFARVETWAKILSSVLGVIAASLALLGWKGLVSLRQKVQTDVQSFLKSDAGFQADMRHHINRAVQETAESKYGKISREVSLGRLEMLSRKVEQSEGYSESERDAMIELLLSVSDDPEIRKSDAFASTVLSVLKSLTGAGLDAYVDDLDDKLRDTFVKNSSLALRLLHHYGERSLEQDESNADLLARFDAYVSASRRHSSFASALPYLLALEHDRQGANAKKRIKNMLEEIRHLSINDRNHIRDRFEAASSGSEDGVEHFRVRQEREKLKAFNVEYAAQLSKILGQTEAKATA